MLTDDYFARFETPKYVNKNPIQRRLIRRFVRTIHAMFVAANPCSRVLEVGVGEGFLSGYLSEQFPEKSFSGIDLDSLSVDRLRAKFPRIDAKVGAIEDPSLLSPPYDLVMCCEVLEHVQDPPAVLRTLDSFGAKRLILSVPHEPFFMLSNLARGKNVTRLGNDPEHLHHWTKTSFGRFLAQQLDILEIDTSYPWIVALCGSRRA